MTARKRDYAWMLLMVLAIVLSFWLVFPINVLQSALCGWRLGDLTRKVWR